MSNTSDKAHRDLIESQNIALARFLHDVHPDEPLTVADIHRELGGKLWVESPGTNGAASLQVNISLEDLRDRLYRLQTFAIVAARPRVRASTFERRPFLKEFVQTGAFYSLQGGGNDRCYVYDTAARWYWNSVTSSARLYNNVLPYSLFRYHHGVALYGLPRPAKGGPQQECKLPPLSTLPEGVNVKALVAQGLPEPEPDETEPDPVPEPAEVVVEQPELPFPEPEVHPHDHTALVNGSSPAVLVPEEPYWQVIANDGEPGGTLVLQSNDHVIVASITTVVQR